MVDTGDRQLDLIELPIPAVGFKGQRQLLPVTYPLRLQGTDATVEFAGQYRVFTRRDLEIQLVTVAGFGAEMHLGRGEQRRRARIVFNRVAAEAVAGNLQAITGGARCQRPTLAAAGIARGNQAFALQFALAVEQVQALFVGIRVPRGHPADGQRVGTIRLQVQAAVANIGPTHGRRQGAQREAKAQQQQEAFHADFRCSI